MRSDAQRLEDIAKAIEAIERYRDNGRAAFLRDELIQTWMIHHLEIIGEALRSMTSDFQARFRSHLEWNGWIGLRTILTHHYFRIDPELVWGAIERDVPVLKETITRLNQELRDRPS